MSISKLSIKHVSLVVAATLSLLANGCNSEPRDLAEIKEDGVLRVAMNYNPLGYYRQGDDTITGLQHDMVQALAKELGVEVSVVVNADLDGSIEDLENGEYDLLARLIPVTKELKEKVQFTNPICLDRQVLVQRKKNALNQDKPYIKSQLELPGHCISMPKNSPYISRLRNLAQEIGDTIQIEEIANYQSEQLIILVAKGDLDYTVCNYNLAKKIGEQYDQLDYKTAISFSQMQAWAVNKKSKALLEEVNKWIDKNTDKFFNNK